MPATPSPSAESRVGARRAIRGWFGRLLPRSFAARLTIAFSGVVALTLVLVFVGVINRVDDYFYTQQVNDLQVRAGTVRDLIISLSTNLADGQPIV